MATSKLETFAEVFRGKGLRLTHQRLEVYRALMEAKDHPSAEEVHGRLKERLPTVSLDTVYRTLATMEKHRLVSRVEALDDKSRFDLNLEPHHHVVCVKCKSVRDFRWPEFERLAVPGPALADGATLVGRHGEIRVVCRKCSGKRGR